MVGEADADRTTLHDTALRYIQQGWEPLPLPPHAKSPVVPGHTGYRGQPVTAAHWNRWATQGVKITDGPITVYNGPTQGCNLGLRMPPGVIGIDIDHYWTPSRDKRGGDTITALETKLGKLPPTYSSTSRPGTPSKILFYRIPTGVMLVTKLEDVEIIQHHHRYAAIAPSAHPDGRPYLWYDPQDWDLTLDDIPNIDDLTELPWGWVEYLRAHGKTGAADAASPAEVREFIRTHTASTRPQALRGLGTALRNATGARHDTLITTACWAMREAAAGWYPAEEAIELLVGWWADVMDDPDRAGTSGGEFGSAVLWAVGQANANPERITELRTKAETPDDDWDWVGGTPNNPSGTGEPQPAPPAAGYTTGRMWDNLIHGDAITRLPAVEWHIPGVIQTNSLAALYGPPKTFKTFTAIDLAMHLANRPHWRNIPIPTPVRTLYVVAEGAAGVGPRATAWVDRNGGNMDLFSWVPMAPDLFQNADEAMQLAAIAERYNIGLVIVDTLARSIPGAEENSAKDLGLVIRHLDLIRTHSTAAVMIVHHMGKVTGQGMRGSNALRGAIDTGLELKGDRTSICMAVADQKNAESGREFWWRPTTEGPSIVLEPSAGPPDKNTDDTRVMQLNCLRQLYDLGGTASDTAWSNRCAVMLTVGRKLYVRHRADLLAAGEVTMAETIKGSSKAITWALTEAGLSAIEDLD